MVDVRDARAGKTPIAATQLLATAQAVVDVPRDLYDRLRQGVHELGMCAGSLRDAFAAPRPSSRVPGWSQSFPSVRGKVWWKEVCVRSYLRCQTLTTSLNELATHSPQPPENIDA